jgi:hypothetical protein
MDNLIQFKRKISTTQQSISQVSTELVNEPNIDQKKITVGQLIKTLSEYDKDVIIDINVFMKFKDGTIVGGYNSNEESLYIDDEFVEESNNLCLEFHVKAIEKE